ncbi:Fic family protein [uncultured Deefgea sp.]|uniref:Fic family protein n=1 Tax=uncultured Deefgea sp. TaxID=1304914 RepID=UPI002598A2DD|nr:Fic family protein [uncultured Deefgea sp.]
MVNNVGESSCEKENSRNESYWLFLSAYLNGQYEKNFCLNPEASLLLQLRSSVIPAQIIVATNSENVMLSLPEFNSSLCIYKDEKRVFDTRIEVQGLQVIPLAEALCRVSSAFYASYPEEIELALERIGDVEALLNALPLAADCFQLPAEHVAEALERVGRKEDAMMIRNEVLIIHHVQPILGSARQRSPYVQRLQAMWSEWREDVIAIFPPAPGLSHQVDIYLEQVQARYIEDAYNSMSIEGYSVTDVLIERVGGPDWQNEGSLENYQDDKNVIAARGYFQAFQAVKQSLKAILLGKNAGMVAKQSHHEWHKELFFPLANLGFVQLYELAGYRTGLVFIRNSRHTPLPRDAILDAMETLFELLHNEPEPAVRAVLGHHIFVFIHPYFDGNGRIGRLLMNTMLASGGYPWTVIRVENRDKYLAALEDASVNGNIKPLAQFLLAEMRSGGATKILGDVK